MTNFEKLLEDPENRRLIIELTIESMPANFCIDVNNMKIDKSVECKECIFRNKNGIKCDIAMIKWLREEYKEVGEEYCNHCNRMIDDNCKTCVVYKKIIRKKGK